MKLKHVVYLLILLLTAQSFASEECEQRLAVARQQITDEDMFGFLEQVVQEQIIGEEIVGSQEIVDLESEIDLLTSIVLPNGYAETQEEYNAARAKAQELNIIRERLSAQFNSWDRGLSFEQRFDKLARRYEETENPLEKAAILSKLVSSFAISIEDQYMQFIESQNYSKDLRKALYKALHKMFLVDPSWLPPLEKAARNGGL